MWEDSRNKRGGRWLVSLAKQQRHSELDRLWLETVSGHGERREGWGVSPTRRGWADVVSVVSRIVGALPVTQVEVSSSSLLGPSCCA